MSVIVLVVVLLLFLTYSCKNHLERLRDVNKLPGPSALQFLKEVYFDQSSQGLMNYLASLNKKYGKIVRVPLNPFKPAIITTDQEFCKKVYINKDLHTTPIFNQLKFLREGFPTFPDYGTWKSEKLILLKALDKQFIGNRVDIFNKKYNTCLDMIRCNLGKPIDLQEMLETTFLEIIMGSVNDPNVYLSGEEIKTYLRYRVDYFRLLLEKMNTFRMMGFFHIFTENYRLKTEIESDLENFAGIWLERFKTVNKNLREKHNLVYAMINNGLPDRRIAANIHTIIQGGHDTGIFPSCMLFREMAQRSELQQRILEEIRSVLGTDTTTTVTLADLDKMTYLQAAIKESVRRYTPIPVLDRDLIDDITIGNIRIPKGTNVMFNFPGILTSEENYEDPLSFKPERFLKENVTSKDQKSFIGFGYGPKSCPGKHLSYAVIKLLVVKILREFEVSPTVPHHDLKLTADILFKSTNGIPVVFRKRNFGTKD